jgi:hypothetical protein
MEIQKIIPNSEYYNEWMRFLNRKINPVVSEYGTLVGFDTVGNPDSKGLDDLWIGIYKWRANATGTKS